MNAKVAERQGNLIYKLKQKSWKLNKDEEQSVYEWYAAEINRMNEAMREA